MVPRDPHKWDRTIDTRIFSRMRDRFSYRVNELEVRNQSVLRSVL